MAISPIWPADTARNSNGELTFHGITASTLFPELDRQAIAIMNAFPPETVNSDTMP